MSSDGKEDVQGNERHIEIAGTAAEAEVTLATVKTEATGAPATAYDRQLPDIRMEISESRSLMLPVSSGGSPNQHRREHNRQRSTESVSSDDDYHRRTGSVENSMSGMSRAKSASNSSKEQYHEHSLKPRSPRCGRRSIRHRSPRSRSPKDIQVAAGAVTTATTITNDADDPTMEGSRQTEASHQTITLPAMPQASSGNGSSGLFLSSVPLSPQKMHRSGTWSGYRWWRRGRQRYNTESSLNSASSKSSSNSVLLNNMQRVRNINNLFNIRSRGHSRGRSRASSMMSDDDDVSSASEFNWSTRMLPRDNVFHQSSGEIQVDQVATKKFRLEIQSLYLYDWWHRVLSVPVGFLMLTMALLYTSYLLVFSSIYYLFMGDLDPRCAFDPDSTELFKFQTAFSWALENAGTVGYGFPPPGSGGGFWSGCWELPCVGWIQAFVGILLNALTIGVVVTRMGKADSRSYQVIFSNKATITFNKGEFHLSFQVYDLSPNPIPEAHVRTYVVLNESDGVNSANFQTRHMRLQNPNDTLGGYFFLSVPCTVVHTIDQWSPLLPPAMRREHWASHDDNFVHNAGNRLQYPGINCREQDSATLSRRGSSCPVCGANMNTDELLLRHVRYHKFMENDYEQTDGSDNEDIAGDNDIDHVEEEEHKEEDVEVDGNVRKVGSTTVSDPGVDSEGSKLGSTPGRTSSKKKQAVDVSPSPPTSTFATPIKKLNPHNNRNAISTSALGSGLQDNSRDARRNSANSAHSVHSGKSLKVHQSHHSHSSNGPCHSDNSDGGKSHYSHHSRYSSVHQSRLKKIYNEEIRRGLSTSVHHHQFVRLGGKSTIDHQLKELAHINKPQNHQNLDMSLLITHDRLLSIEQYRKNEEEWKESFQNNTQKENGEHNSDDGIRSKCDDCDKRRPTLLGNRSKVMDDVRSRIRKFIQASELEFIVQVEGIEARSSHTFQARHSYSLDDIVFDHWFENCVANDPETGLVTVDLDKFHKMRPVSEGGLPITSCL